MLLASFESKVFNTYMNQTHAYLERWHQGLKSQEQDFLDEILDEALPYLQEQIAACFQGDDAKEGIAAFLEKSNPNWK